MKQKNFVRYAEKIFHSQPDFRADLGHDRHFQPEAYQKFLDRLNAEMPARSLRMRTVGSSLEGRPIRLLTLGNGPIPVLLWSQMHGDEPTATAAIADILSYFRLKATDEEAKTILSTFSIHFLPMLNPDGAARKQRRTALNIDMNRDALTLVTPEARLLKELQQSLKPEFGFNLHDQELSTVGTSRELTAIAVLAPAYNEEKSDNDVRRKAKNLVSAFAETMNLFVEGRVAKYDDGFEPRAFGDNIQKWGTSTMLVESGHAKGDRQKESIRRLNVTGILAGLYAIATGEYLHADPNAYAALPFNSKRAYDLVVRNVSVETEGGLKFKTDLGISSQVDTHSEDPPRLVDMGDLSTFTGWEELDGTGLVFPQTALRIGAPVDPSIFHRT